MSQATLPASEALPARARPRALPVKHKKRRRLPKVAELRQRFAKVQAGGACDDHVLTFAEWCGLNGISIATGRRIKASGEGPRFVRLGDRHLGVTIGDNRAWRLTRAD
jgi:hypothetical protein